ncbi:FAD-dependent monooxygenase [Streptomyces sp. NPDC006923]|uniref:FAD-dependent monooxygenase n=1 Tax=Streptomyces sp. NPDC006923 TaxID=3155355 RepID=UPI0033F135E1
MRIAVIGAGPGGLYTASLVKRLLPGHEVDVWERDAADETFGFGVVFSDGALGGIEAADPVLFASITAEFARWSRIDVRHRGRTTRNEGYGFSAISRRVLLSLLRRRCAALGVTLRFRTPAPDPARLAEAYDLVVAADGVNSATRTRYSDAFGTEREIRGARYMWLGTDLVLDALTFAVAETEFGPVQAHAYPYAPGRGTFIVEVNEDVWHAAGFERTAAAPLDGGGSDTVGIERVGHFFADFLRGHSLEGNKSRWGRFAVVRNRRWSHRNIALLGDSAHTTHFSIGSGTKLAMEDALDLALALREHGTVPEALAAYEAERKPAVDRMQGTALASLEWFEEIDRCVGFEPEVFNAHLLTRSGRIGRQDLPSHSAERIRLIRDRFEGADEPPSRVPSAG